MTIKFCKDCKYMEKRTLVWSMPEDVVECWHPQSTKFDLVSGKPKYAFCSISRQWGPCGPEGMFWERKNEK